MIAQSHLGWIFLDIDGTITDRTHRVPQEVKKYLCSLKQKGWELVFVTGRTFSFAQHAIQAFDFPYFLAVQNGADILAMPQKVVVMRHYLNGDMIPILEEMYRTESEDFLVYAGFERGDFCYYRPEKFSPSLTAHLKKMMPLCDEPWQAVSSFQFDPEMQFPLIKCLGSKESMQSVHDKLQKVSSIAVTMIHEPLSENIYLNLVTSDQATKGKAAQAIQKLLKRGGRVIAAGDDLNDVSMLEVADVKIVMNTAPQKMHSLADILAASGDECGIINALQTAIQRS